MFDLKNNPNVKFWYLFNFNCCCGNYNGRQNRLKIGEIAILDQIEGFGRLIF